MGRSGGGTHAGRSGASGGGGSLGGAPSGHSGGGGSFGSAGRSSGRSYNRSTMSGMTGLSGGWVGNPFGAGQTGMGRTQTTGRTSLEHPGSPHIGGQSAPIRPGPGSHSQEEYARRAATGGFAAMGRSGGGFSGGGFGGGGGSLGGSPIGHSGGGGSFGGAGRSGGGPSGGGFGGGGFGGGGGGPVFGGGPRGPMLFGGLGRIGCGTIVAVIILVGILMMATMFSSVGTSSSAGSGDITESTVAREKLTGGRYSNEVYDELGWLSNTNSVANQLKAFFDKTGVQPAIYLENRPDLIGDSAAQEAEAQRLFQELGLGDNAFLFTYFDNNGTDGDWTTWVGNSAGTVMDPQAIQIFGDYLNKYWRSDVTEDELFVGTFDDTADRIMSRTTNANDVAIYVWIALGVVAAGLAIFFIARQRRQHEAARAAETERILKADIKDLNNDDDELLKKYQNNK